MTTIRTALYDRVSGVSSITDILGTSPTRFRWSNVPQGETVPYTRYFVVTRAPQRGHDGPAGLSLATVQVEHYAEDADAVEALARAFETNLNGTRNGTVTLLLENEYDAFQVQQTLWQVNQDWQVQWKET